MSKNNCKDPNKEKKPDKNGKLRCMLKKLKCKDPNKEKKLDKNGKLRCMLKIKKTPKKTSPKKKISSSKKTSPKKNNSPVIPSFIIKNFNKINITKHSLEQYYGTLYLIYKYSEQCIVLPYDENLYFTQQTSPKWSHLTLTYDEKTNTLIFPNNFWKYVKDCISKSKRFIIIPFGFDCIGNVGHSNMIVYDKYTNEIERFEPNGSISGSCFPEDIDLILHKQFKSNINSKIKYIKPLDFCPFFSFQKIAHVENILDSGNCIFWSLWYADLRLSNPDINRKQLVSKAIESLKNKDYFNLFIIRYGKFIAELTSKVRKTKNPKKTFLRLIKKYI